MVLKFYSTPGHGYLAVPKAALAKSGFEPSEFSYESDDNAMLEEDCDAPGFIRAARKNGDNVFIEVVITSEDRP